MMNLNKPGGLAAGQSLNPKTPTRFAVVFEVPYAKYSMRVIVPNRTLFGPSGGAAVAGNYFVLDFGNHLEL